ncbi:MAG: hypothetical protein WD358_04665 [Nitriliruptoraceae bacterium]
MKRVAKWLALFGALLGATIVGTNFGWRWVMAPLLGFGMLTWLFASLRVLVHDGRNAGESVDDDVDEHANTLFWCEECGTELLLIVRGSKRPPSHCGQRMHERTELLN